MHLFYRSGYELFQSIKTLEKLSLFQILLKQLKNPFVFVNPA